MKIITLILTVLIAVVFASGIMAVPPDKTLEFAGSDNPMGKVTLSGKTHKEAGLKCKDCHPKVFKMKSGTAEITKKDHVPGKFCGTCHNGEKAFAQKGNCKKCHKK